MVAARRNGGGDVDDCADCLGDVGNCDGIIIFSASIFFTVHSQEKCSLVKQIDITLINFSLLHGQGKKKRIGRVRICIDRECLLHNAQGKKNGEFCDSKL